MRAFLFLIPLAAHAAASPCDPACDPKCDPKAKPPVTVVSCDPKTGAQSVNTFRVGTRATVVQPACGHAVSTVCSTTPQVVAVGQGHACSVGGTARSGGTCNSTSSQPATLALVQGEPVQIDTESMNSSRSLADLAQIVRGVRAGQVGTQGLDDDAREEIRAAIEEAREAQRNAAEEMRDALREAQEARREALEEQREAIREAQQAQREAELQVREQLREAQAAHPEAFGSVDFQAQAQAALESANEALAGIDFGSAFAIPPSGFDFQVDVEDAAQGDEPADLEDRIRALERIAREQGHGTVDGSLEDRVAALERALGARKSAVRGLRAPRVQAPRGALAPRAYTLQGDGTLREFPMPPQAMSPFETQPRSAHAAPVAPVAPIAPIAPVDPIAPIPPAARAPRSSSGGGLGGEPAAATAPWAQGPGSTSDLGQDRRAIEDAMRSLRSEAEALRAEVQRMREKIDSLPRNDAR
ncbi:MAG: V-type ATP synthase subunit E [Planctomycetota bacterium]|nr:V-type ATP synthase subunit E [Planctomycetota bacterium]